jgi:hypothetical protein
MSISKKWLRAWAAVKKGDAVHVSPRGGGRMKKVVNVGGKDGKFVIVVKDKKRKTLEAKEYQKMNFWYNGEAHWVYRIQNFFKRK